MKHKIRIAGAIDPKGAWAVCGYGKVGHPKFDKELRDDLFVDDLENGEKYFFIEAEIELPEVETIQGEIK